MAKLHFFYSTMNAGKSTLLLQAAHNYRERGMQTYLMTAQMDTRAGQGKIASRIGIEEEADTFNPHEDMFEKVKARLDLGPLACIFIDEAQFLSKIQVQQLGQIVDDLNIPVLAFGIRTDFQGELFEGSKYLLAWSDNLKEIKTVCHCGRKATMVVRIDKTGEIISEGVQIEVGGNERYVPLCRKDFYMKRLSSD